MTLPATDESTRTLGTDSLLVPEHTLAKTPKSRAGESLGERLARLRKEKGITQIELAERLGVSQPLVSEWERDGLRLNSEVIVALNLILGVSADDLLGLSSKKTAPSDAAPRRRFIRRLQAMSKLPRRDQEALLRTIDAFLSKAS
jgi:transcriptional regulator with XRE-family HTH domain